MALIKQIDDSEWDLLSIVTDPVLLGEFLRNTADGSPNKEEWPKQNFAYRWYQRDLLTDKSEFISLVAGRAVGKCSPVSARIYTYSHGYMTINDIIKLYGKTRTYPTVYTMDESKNITQRRMKLTRNGYKDVYRITTAAGHTFDGTDNHPILTQRGFIMIRDLNEEDKAAVMTRLPHTSGKAEFVWEELRWLGYVAGKHRISPESPIQLRFHRNVVEMQQITKYFDATFTRYPDGTYALLRKKGPLVHYVTRFLRENHLTHMAQYGLQRVPPQVKAESLDQLRIFLEALFSNYAVFTNNTISLSHPKRTFMLDIQEILLRFGVESKIEAEQTVWKINITDYNSYYQFFQEFDVPGVSAKNLKMPSKLPQPTDFMRFDEILSIEPMGIMPTFAITVQDTENYISDNLLVHNSLVLEDRMIHRAINAEDEFPGTKESTLVTANVSQMTPILDRLIMRLSSSRLLKDFLKGNINRSKGTLDFPMPGGSNYRMNARIAGSRGENNMVGLHVPQITGDEMQIFPMAAFTQLGPTYNGWEANCSQFYAGVPNGLREGNVLYLTDQRSPKFKKYRIPAHQNPFYTYQDDRENLLKYGGEDSEDYVHLVLGRHGEPAFSIIPRDKIILEPFDFYTHRYSQTDKHNGKHFRSVLALHKLPESKSRVRILSIDTGFTDPTVMNVLGQDGNGVWRTFARYRLTRIPFPEQADIIDWLDSFYDFNIICVDLGAGGGGIGVTQDLQSPRFLKTKRYDKRIHGVRFADYLDNGETSDGMPLRIQAKSFAGQELARLITEGNVIFSELDMEGVSQMERVAYQRNSDGINKYFVMSEKGTGKSADDHIFASYIVFVLTLLTALFERPRRKLISPGWL